MEGKYGLLGEKLGHSYSPAIHALLGDYDYKLYECPKDKLDEFLTRRDFAGLNVTIPYKKAVIPHCAQLSPIAEKLGISVNTVAKYVGKLEEHGLIITEHTDITTKEGLKRNGCLKYTILPIQHAVDLWHERQMEELMRTAAQQKAQAKADKLGVEFIPADSEQSA